jgi:hypothetical protein
MSQGYDQMGNQMLTEEASIQEQRMGREQELMMSDRMAQQQVDEYNAGRMGRGIQTGLQIAGSAANLYSGISAGMASNAAADMYGRIGQEPDTSGLQVDGYDSTGATTVKYNSGKGKRGRIRGKRNINTNVRGSTLPNFRKPTMGRPTRFPTYTNLTTVHPIAQIPREGRADPYMGYGDLGYKGQSTWHGRLKNQIKNTKLDTQGKIGLFDWWSK